MRVLVHAGVLVSLLFVSACNKQDGEQTGGGSPTGPSGPSNPSGPPSVSGITVLPRETGLASVTSYAFQGLGLQGSGLSYSWEFGDGTVSGSSSPTHVFQHPGSYQVRLAVRNSAGSSDTVSTPVQVKSLTGRWAVVYNSGFGNRGTLDLIQNGTTLQGIYRDPDIPNAVVEASAINGRNIQIRLFQQYLHTSLVMVFNGNLDDSIDRVTGSMNVTSSFVMTRQ